MPTSACWQPSVRLACLHCRASSSWTCVGPLQVLNHDTEWQAALTLSWVLLGMVQGSVNLPRGQPDLATHI